jgi:hypothetical protein
MDRSSFFIVAGALLRLQKPIAAFIARLYRTNRPVVLSGGPFPFCPQCRKKPGTVLSGPRLWESRVMSKRGTRIPDTKTARWDTRAGQLPPGKNNEPERFSDDKHRCIERLFTILSTIPV